MITALRTCVSFVVDKTKHYGSAESLDNKGNSA